LRIDEVVLLFVGHFSSDKRPSIAYDAFKALRDKGYDCKLIMVGKTSGGFEIDATLSKKIVADAESRGIRDKLLMVEKTTSTADYMKASDFLVHPSVREGSPNVVIEAMACGLPSIVTKIPGVTDALIVDRFTGFLMAADDSDALCGILEEGILDRRLCNTIGAEATKFVSLRHDLTVVSMAIKHVYNTVALR
jgi:glycosyltransferase involved in cell wall biosynthesis